MTSPDRARAILHEVEQSPLRGSALRRLAMALLHRLPDWDWAGIYRLEGDTLVLDVFEGEETEHRRIPVGVGVCGTAVAEDRNQIVPDVRLRSNYLACSIRTRSELVVLIRRGGAVLGQIDIDSHRAGTFDAGDEAFLESLGALLVDRWEEGPPSSRGA